MMWLVVVATLAVCRTALGAEPADWTQSGRPPAAVVDRLESAFLSSLGMQRRPDRPAAVPDYLREMYARVAPATRELNTLHLNLPGKLTGSANTVRSFVHSDDKVDPHKYPANLQRLWFNVSSVPADEALRAAELRLWWSETEGAAAGRHTVRVYDIVRRTGAGGRPVLRLVDTLAVSTLARGRQLSLDVRPAVHRWLARPASNHGLLVRVVAPVGADERVRLRPAGAESAGDWQRRQPLLVAYTDDGRSRSRVRRRAGGHKRRHEECRRRRLYVNFYEVGWNNWIVAPPDYEAHFCHGECSRFPMPAHLNATNHAIVQTLVHRKGSGVPPPCCIPTELSSISMLYTNNNNKVVLKNYQDMVVEECGCR